MPRYKVVVFEKYRVTYEVDAENEDQIHDGSVDLWNVVDEASTGDDFEVYEIEEIG